METLGTPCNLIPRLQFNLETSAIVIVRLIFLRYGAFQVPLIILNVSHPDWVTNFKGFAIAMPLPDGRLSLSILSLLDQYASLY